MDRVSIPVVHHILYFYEWLSYHLNLIVCVCVFGVGGRNKLKWGGLREKFKVRRGRVEGFFSRPFIFIVLSYKYLRVHFLVLNKMGGGRGGGVLVLAT